MVRAYVARTVGALGKYKKFVATGTALANGAADIYMTTSGGWLPWVVIGKNILAPIAYVLVDDPTGFLEGLGVSGAYFWGLVLGPQAKAPTRRTTTRPHRLYRIGGIKRTVVALAR